MRRPRPPPAPRGAAEIRTYAPRSLKEPVRWRFSRASGAPVRRPARTGGGCHSAGSSGLTPASIFCAPITSSSRTAGGRSARGGGAEAHGSQSRSSPGPRSTSTSSTRGTAARPRQAPGGTAARPRQAPHRGNGFGNAQGRARSRIRQGRYAAATWRVLCPPPKPTAARESPAAMPTSQDMTTTALFSQGASPERRHRSSRCPPAPGGRLRPAGRGGRPASPGQASSATRWTGPPTCCSTGSTRKAPWA